MRTLNDELTYSIREAQSAVKKAQQEYSQLVSRYELTDEAKEKEVKRLAAAARAAVSAARETGRAAIRARCDALDREESAVAAARMIDRDYWESLDRKVRLIRSADKTTLTDAQLRGVFSEFKNDPVAASVISGALKGRAAFVLPEDNTGKRQKHLRETVAAGFDNALTAVESANSSDYDFVTGAIMGNSAICDAFCNYAMNQNEDFSIPDANLFG